VRAFLAQTTIKLQDLLSLQAGDVITTDKGVERDVLIQVEGRNKFVGQVGQLRGNKSVRITRVCQEPAEPKPVGPERIGGSGAGDRR
jgi:flagellar motor switch protein FliM